MKVERVGWGVGGGVGGWGGGGPSFRQTFQAEASSVEEMEGEESALHGLTQPRVQPIYAPVMDLRPLHTHYYIQIYPCS